MIEEILQDIGLSKRESKCYLALLELGPSKTGIICKKSAIPSSKIYEILGFLIHKGLVTYVIKGKIKFYQAENPSVLINLIEEKKKEVQNILPQLLLKQQFTIKNSVEVYEGQKAIFSLFTSLIEDAKPKEQYAVFSINEENKDEKVNLFFKNLSVRRKEKRLDVRLLKNIKYYSKEKHTKLQIRYTHFNLPQGITIFRNNIVLLSYQVEPIAIKIESKAFASQLKDFFIELWDEAKC